MTFVLRAFLPALTFALMAPNELAHGSYTHADHLGSPVATTDASGAVTWRESLVFDWSAFADGPYGEAPLKTAAHDSRPSLPQRSARAL